MRVYLALVAMMSVSACSPSESTLYQAASTTQMLVAIQVTGHEEAVSHAVFAEPQMSRSGEYSRLDVRKAYDCKSRKVSIKEVSAFSADGKLISTATAPAEWTSVEGLTSAELQIVCDPKFARTQKLNGALSEVEALYRKKLAER